MITCWVFNFCFSELNIGPHDFTMKMADTILKQSEWFTNEVSNATTIISIQNSLYENNFAPLETRSCCFHDMLVLHASQHIILGILC